MNQNLLCTLGIIILVSMAQFFCLFIAVIHLGLSYIGKKITFVVRFLPSERERVFAF